MATVVVSASNVANFPDGGGHFWVCMQYVQALRRLGCDVHWMERFTRGRDRAADDALVAAFLERMRRFGLEDRVIVYAARESETDGNPSVEFIQPSAARAKAVMRRAELLLNFHYGIDPSLLRLFRRTALVDIDPGLLQFWMATGQIEVPAHDLYFTTGETVGRSSARFPACGVSWIYSPPPVFLDLWPEAREAPGAAYSTISSWWGGGAKGHAEWVVDGADVCYDNCKRVSFLEYLELPRRTTERLELALNLADDEDDTAERQLLERMGWRVRHSREVAGSPEAYQAYIQGSRGEFSCAKPSCMKFQNAWISDRTVCYLASGRPAVVQHTGPSAFLPDGEGMFRFSTLGEAAAALDAVESDYARHSRAAREIAATYFDATPLMRRMLDLSLR